jgi:hypothetical protein
MNDVLPVIDVAAIDVRVGLVSRRPLAIPLVTAQVPITALRVYSSSIPAQSAVETTSNRPPTTGVPAARPVIAAA